MDGADEPWLQRPSSQPAPANQPVRANPGSPYGETMLLSPVTPGVAGETTGSNLAAFYVFCHHTTRTSITACTTSTRSTLGRRLDYIPQKTGKSVFVTPLTLPPPLSPPTLPISKHQPLHLLIPVADPEVDLFAGMKKKKKKKPAADFAAEVGPATPILTPARRPGDREGSRSGEGH